MVNKQRKNPDKEVYPDSVPNWHRDLSPHHNYKWYNQDGKDK